MTGEEHRAELARSIYERWEGYLKEARSTLPAGVAVERMLHRAIALWREHEPPELAFVAEELAAERRETRHETTEDRFIEQVERGELIALQRQSDGAIDYLVPTDYARLSETERAAYVAYDPLLARAIRRHVVEQMPSPHTSAY